MTASVVLVHGAFHGGWCWTKVVDGLTAEGIEVVAVDLPGHGVGDTREIGGLHRDAAHVRETLHETPGPIVLVGHSYGGAVITEAGAGRPDVAHLVYLAAVVPDDGEGIGGASVDLDPETLAEMHITESFVPSDDGSSVRVADDAVRAIFYHDCADDDVAFAAARLTPQSTESFADIVQGAAWRDIPATYILCTDDRTVPPAVQAANAARTGTVVEIDASHSPFFSKPDEVVAILASIARANG
ncbi:MAG: alpha/beta fold hydrolase [Acidimicrobiia bacterium]